MGDNDERWSDADADAHLAEVIEGVFLGDRHAAAARAALRSRGITAIINAAAPRDPPDGDSSVPCHFEASGEGVSYLQVAVRDVADAPIEAHFDACHAFINSALERGDAVLVHCEAGRSRSATIVLSYVMRTKAKSLSEALNCVKLRRNVFPNAGFVRKLHAFAEHHGLPRDDTAGLETAGASEMAPEEAAEANFKRALWRMQQGAWFTSRERESEALLGSGYAPSLTATMGIICSLEGNAEVLHLAGELLEPLFAAAAAAAAAGDTDGLAETLKAHLLQDKDVEEFPKFDDLLLDLPMAPQILAGFLAPAFEVGALGGAFRAYLAGAYPEVAANIT